jgi:hypothetical protein
LRQGRVERGKPAAAVRLRHEQAEEAEVDHRLAQPGLQVAACVQPSQPVEGHLLGGDPGDAIDQHLLVGREPEMHG